jgi:hypothetical protein
MKIDKLELLLKVIWSGLILFTIFIFGWLTFICLTFGNIFTEKFNIWNLLIPNILTIGVLIFYTKEILSGYKPKSKNRNLKSLIIFSIFFIMLTLIQIPQFEILFTGLKPELWQIIISLIIVLASYLGIIMNRILKIKELNKTTAHNTV